ncbi:PP0621 family protein [Sulfurimonas sp.]|uniref:PP0621 family protein n=1 Tax=Sulfurimonas sp. TaxID=2022749 RepID=UPI00356228D1
MSPQWIVVIGLIAVIYFMFIKKRPQVKQDKKDSTDKTTKKEAQSNDMVACAECGIYCEIDDTILSNNKYYCSQECLKKS